MRSSRKATAAFVGVFLIGIAVGALLMWNLTDTELVTFMNKTNDSEDKIVERLNKKYADMYHLSDDETQRIQPLLHAMAKNLSQERRQFGVNIINTLDESHQKIAAEMTPEHRALYDKYYDSRRKQISTMLLLDQNPAATVK